MNQKKLFNIIFINREKVYVSRTMTKKEFYLISIIVIYTYLAIIFQLNVKNFISLEKNPRAKMSFNLFE